MAVLSTEVKLAWAFGLSVGILLTDSTLGQLALILCLFCIALYGGLRSTDFFGYFRLFIPVFAIIFLLHLFYHPGNILFRLWFLEATDTGLRAGLFNLARFINFILLAICFFHWTSPVDIAVKVTTGFGLVRGRIFQELALVLFIAMRFMPALIREKDTVRLAMTARGANLKGDLINRLRMNVKLLLPLFSRVLGFSDDVAAALALKSSNGVYFAVTKPALKSKDILLILMGIILTLMLIVS